MGNSDPHPSMNARLIDLIRVPAFLPLAVTTLTLGVAMSITMPYLSLFSVERANMMPLQLGVFLTMIALSGVIASAAAGKWTDRHGNHCKLMLGSLIASSVGFVLLCPVRNYAALVLIGVVFLGAGGSAQSLMFSFARAVLPVNDAAGRSFALATLRTVMSMAWVFGPAIGALVLAGAGFNGLFLFAAMCFASCGAIVWHMRKFPTVDLHGGPTHYAGDPSTLLESTALAAEEAPQPHEGMQHSRAEIWRAVIALTLVGLTMSATLIVLPLYVVHGMHGKSIDVSIMLGLGALLEMPMMLALGARGARLNKQRWLAAAAAVYMIYFVGVASAQSVEFLIPMQAFSAFVVAVTSCLGMTYIQDLMPHSPGAATALFFNASRVGSIVSGVLAGTLVAALGYRGTFLICGCLMMSALVMFANFPVGIIASRVRDFLSAGRRIRG
jgi:MFS transporter, SET family, sugar efflux transporter